MTNGFEFSGSGRLERIDVFTSKAGKNILALILKVEGQFEQLVPIKIFGKLVDESSDWQPGNVLQVPGRLGGREWQGKVYGDIIATHVHVIGQGSAKAQQPQQQELPPPPSDSDIPF